MRAENINFNFNVSGKVKRMEGKISEYKNSGDTAGDKMRVVGYGCYAFYEE